jgi:hypothetical protein
MVPHDHRSPRIQHLVRHHHILRPRRRRILNAPVDRNHQQIALRPRCLHRPNHARLIHPRRPARLSRIREEVHMRQLVLVRIAIAIQPPRHPQPAHLDAVGLGNHRLPALLCRISGARKQQPHLAQVFARLRKSRPPLIHRVVVGKRNDLDPAGL